MFLEISKDTAGIFMIRTPTAKLIGFSLDLKLKIQRLIADYQLKEIEILLQCHRNYKGLHGTKLFLENKAADFLQIHKAKPFEIKAFAKTKELVKVVQIKTVPKVIKEPKKPKEPKPKKERKQRDRKRKDPNKPHGNIGKKHSAERTAKIAKSKIGNTNCLGRVLSEETKAQISESNKGKNKGKGLGVPLSDAHKEKIRLANIGKKQSEETIAKRVAKTKATAKATAKEKLVF